jgi:hypothetical protein
VFAARCVVLGNVVAQLRANAGFMGVLEAQATPIDPEKSEVYRWLTKVQIGGDVVYVARSLQLCTSNSMDAASTNT